MTNTTSTPNMTTLVGIVKTFSDKVVRGWVAGDAETFPILIELSVNGEPLLSTWADSSSQVNSWDETKSFTLGIRDIWPFLKRGDKISIHADGFPLPIVKYGQYYSVETDGTKQLEILYDHFNQGYVFDRTGRLRLAKDKDPHWQDQMISLYQQVNETLKATTGYDAFIFYGTLLGQVRQRDFIGHDDDFDAAYLSTATDGSTAANEVRDIGYSLIDAGFQVYGRHSTLHVHDPANPSNKIDLFHIYFNGSGELALPFGRAGTTEYTTSDWHGLEYAPLGTHNVLTPVNPAPLVQHLYGDNWNIPQAGFSWKQARVSRDRTGLLTQEHKESLYWASFYAHHQFDSGSSFYQHLEDKHNLPECVLDIGCGDGRDSFAFAKSGYQVIGIDRSPTGVEQAIKRSRRENLGSNLTFTTCDIVETTQFEDIIRTARAGTHEKPILFYMRFFLHSITEEAQEALLTTIANAAQNGDYFAAEFRTDRDRVRNKTFGDHYRRYQNGWSFGRKLTNRFGFTILEEVAGTGLSVYKNEDPHLYRVVARKGLTPRTALHVLSTKARLRASLILGRLSSISDPRKNNSTPGA